MAQLETTVLVAVSLTRLQAALIARAAVMVTSALDCKDVNAAEQGLLLFRQAAARAVSSDTAQNSTEQPTPTGRLRRRAG